MTLALLGNTLLRMAVRQNLVTFPAQIRSFAKRASGDLPERIVQLYFVRGWSVCCICNRYGLSKASVHKVLADWRIRAVESGYIQEVEPDSVAALIPQRTPKAGPSTQEDPVIGMDLAPELVPDSKATNRALIVVGDASVRRALHTTLHILGFNIDEAGSGEEALALGWPGLYTAVLLDADQRRRNGIDTCRELRRLLPEAAIIIFTVADDLERNMEALDSGANHCLSTPFHAGELVACIRDALRDPRKATRNRDCEATIHRGVAPRSQGAVVFPAGRFG